MPEGERKGELQPIIDRGCEGGCSERVGNEFGNWGCSWGRIGNVIGEVALAVSTDEADGPGYNNDGGIRDFDNWNGDLGGCCEFDDPNTSDAGEIGLVDEFKDMLLLLSHFLSLFKCLKMYVIAIAHNKIIFKVGNPKIPFMEKIIWNRTIGMYWRPKN